MLRIALVSIHLFCLLLASASSVHALIEIGRPGEDPLVVEDVYLREGTAFIAIDDVLAALSLEGEWDSVAHLYQIRTPHGRAIISPEVQQELEILMQYYLTYLLERGLNTPAFLRRVRRTSKDEE